MPTSPGSAPILTTSSQLSLSENVQALAMLTATDDLDSVGNGLTFSLNGGADSTLFSLDALTGNLQFINAPDFENPGDADHDNVYDLVVRVTDSLGEYSDTALSVQVTDQATLQLILTGGQSLSVGVTQTQSTLSSTAQYPTQVLGMDFTGVPANTGWQNTAVDPAAFNGFAPLVETVSETPVSGMMNMLAHQYQANSLTAPTFLSISAGSAGKSILQLGVTQSDIYTSYNTALQNTTAGDIFAVNLNNINYAFYVRTATGSLSYGNKPGPLVYYDNLVEQIHLAVDYGRLQGFEISPTVVLSWIQGQNDYLIDSTAAGKAGYGYNYALGKLFDDLEGAVDQIIGTNAEVVGVVSQVRGSSERVIALDQINFISNNPKVAFGASEYQFGARYPSAKDVDYDHLSPEGYYMFGQTIGTKMFDFLTGNENVPITMDNVRQISATSVLVHFSGVDTYLVNDPSIYSAQNDIQAPSNMGFALHSSSGGALTNGLAISGATIVGTDLIQIDFNQALTGAFRLSLGRSPDALGTYAPGALPGFGGTTLRDASVQDALPSPDGVALSDPYIYEYAPIQYFNIGTNSAPVITSSKSVTISENTTFVVDVNVTDNASSEGNGVLYSITTGGDSALFTVDAATGVLSFITAPDRENPTDFDFNNLYVVNVAVSDGYLITNYVQTVLVANVNEAPTAIADPGYTVASDAPQGLNVGTVLATDPDAGDTLTYALQDNLGGALVIDPATGVLSIASAGLLAAYEGQILALPVSVTDAAGLSLNGLIHLTVNVPAGNPTDYIGTTGNDVLTGTSLDENFYGLAGNDTLNGGAGNDLLNGGPGNDRITGGLGIDLLDYNDAGLAVKVSLAILNKAQNTSGGGVDTLVDLIENLTGSAYNDTLTGNALDNLITGLAGNDQINGGAGADTMIGGMGGDVYTVDNVGDVVIENINEGSDTINASISYSLSANVERLIQTGTTNIDGAGNDLANTIYGNAGNNFLSGGLGNDVMLGGDGNDTLNGGRGADKLTGGIGSDTFLFDVLETSANKDTIADFTSAQDFIAFSRSAFTAFAGAPAGALNAAEFATGTAATTASHHVIYNSATGALFYDADGVGGAAQVQIAALTNKPALLASDIVLI